VENLIIFGSSGFAREALCWVQDEGKYNVVGFYGKDNITIDGISTIPNLKNEEGSAFLIAVGSSALRKKLWLEALTYNLHPCKAIIHPKAVIGRNNKIANGTIICPLAVLTVNCEIAENVLVNIGATIGHDCRIEAHSNIAPGASISGFCVLGEGSYLGAKSVLREHVKIGDWATVGIGTTVIKNVKPNTTVIGSIQRLLD
jgi:acetyltransferase EpsM